MSLPGTVAPTYVIERLARWSIYYVWSADLLSSSPGPSALRSWWLPVVMASRVKIERDPVTQRVRCPVDEVEAGVTELCVMRLPAKLRDAVIISNTSGGTAEDKARELGCDRATFFRRLSRAYVELLGLFNDHEAGVLRVELENPLERKAPSGSSVKGGKLKRPDLRGISRAVLLDKNATPD